MVPMPRVVQNTVYPGPLVQVYKPLVWGAGGGGTMQFRGSESRDNGNNFRVPEIASILLQFLVILFLFCFQLYLKKKVISWNCLPFLELIRTG